jgi:hypothetical protein
MTDKEQARDSITVEVSEKTFRTLDALRRGGEDLDGMFLRLARAAETSGVFATAKTAAEQEAS